MAQNRLLQAKIAIPDVEFIAFEIQTGTVSVIPPLKPMVNILTLEGKDGQPVQINQVTLEDPKATAAQLGFTMDEFAKKYPAVIERALRNAPLRNAPTATKAS